MSIENLRQIEFDTSSHIKKFIVNQWQIAVNNIAINLPLQIDTNELRRTSYKSTTTFGCKRFFQKSYWKDHPSTNKL